MPDDHVHVDETLMRFLGWCLVSCGYEAAFVPSPHDEHEQSVLVHVVPLHGESYRLFLSRCRIQTGAGDVAGLQLSAFLPIAVNDHIPSLCARCAALQQFAGGGDYYAVVREKDGTHSMAWTAKYNGAYEHMLQSAPECAIEEAEQYVHAIRRAKLAAERYDGLPHWIGDTAHA